MTATDHPTVADLEQLTQILDSRPLDREGLATVLERIELGLHEHFDALGQRGGLLDESERVHRPSLAREEDRLHEQLGYLVHDAEGLSQAAAGHADDDEELRTHAAGLLAALRGFRDAEAHLVLDSAATEVGAGD
jgi:hypothetical protein